MVNILVYAKIPKNPHKIAYVLAATRRRQVAPEVPLQTLSTFTKLVMVSMGVSKLG